MIEIKEVCEVINNRVEVEPTIDVIQKRFVQKLKEVQEWLQSESIEYRVLGSVATSAFLDAKGTSSLDFSRRGAYGAYQCMPDVDMVVPMNDYPRVKAYRDRLERDINFPIGIGILPSVCHFDFRPKEKTSYITHRDLFVPFPTELFTPVSVEFLGEPLVTVDPRMLFHTYVTMGGILRDKDWPKAMNLARFIRDRDVSRFTEADMKPFHMFLAERSRLYPGYRRYHVVANWVRYRVPKWMNYTGTYYGRLLQPMFFGTKKNRAGKCTFFISDALIL